MKRRHSFASAPWAIVVVPRFWPGKNGVHSVTLLSVRRSLVSVVFAAARMIVSGHVRLHLWDIAYRHVATLGPLLLVQTVAALMGAIALALSRRVIVPLGSTLLMAGTIIGFILADTVGLSGSPSPK
jgi:hypothetical protein